MADAAGLPDTDVVADCAGVTDTDDVVVTPALSVANGVPLPDPLDDPDAVGEAVPLPDALAEPDTDAVADDDAVRLFAGHAGGGEIPTLPTDTTNTPATLLVYCVP